MTDAALKQVITSVLEWIQEQQKQIADLEVSLQAVLTAFRERSPEFVAAYHQERHGVEVAQSHGKNDATIGEITELLKEVRKWDAAPPTVGSQ